MRVLPQEISIFVEKEFCYLIKKSCILKKRDIKTFSFYLESIPINDIDGNVYKTVKIGNQWWMAENLIVTHYGNGDPIPNVIDDNKWSDIGAYCVYDNYNVNIKKYGNLYNWYALNDKRKIAPKGWHIPTDVEWKQLEMYIGMSQSEVDNEYRHGGYDGDELKSTTGWYSNGNGTDDYGFAALPAGYRGTNGGYTGIGGRTLFWSATECNSTNAWSRTLRDSDSGIYRNNDCKAYGYSVRCVRD
jgi:uncharacterized protein (TIGR02145 family)